MAQLTTKSASRAPLQRNSRRRCRTQPLRARRTLPPPDQQHDAQDTGGDADSDNRAPVERTKHPAFVNRHGAAWNARHSLFGYRRRLPLSFAYKKARLGARQLRWVAAEFGGSDAGSSFASRRAARQTDDARGRLSSLRVFRSG